MHGIKQFKVAYGEVIEPYKTFSLNTFDTDDMPYMSMLSTLKILEYGTCGNKSVGKIIHTKSLHGFHLEMSI